MLCTLKNIHISTKYVPKMWVYTKKKNYIIIEKTNNKYNDYFYNNYFVILYIIYIFLLLNDYQSKVCARKIAKITKIKVVKFYLNFEICNTQFHT